MPDFKAGTTSANFKTSGNIPSRKAWLTKTDKGSEITRTAVLAKKSEISSEPLLLLQLIELNNSTASVGSRKTVAVTRLRRNCLKSLLLVGVKSCSILLAT